MEKLPSKRLEVDKRGRITLPKEFRIGIDSFAAQPFEDGSIRLTPQTPVPLEEAKLLESLKSSLSSFKRGKTKKVPTNWIG